jgi:hypothetical protein
MGRQNIRICQGLAIAFILYASNASARVYYRWGDGNPQRITVEHSGWRLAEENPVHVNGREWLMQVFAGRGTSVAVMQHLRNTYETRGAVVAQFTGHGDMAWGMAVWPDRLSRWLILDTRALPFPLVFLAHASLDTAPASMVPTLPGIPDYPGAQARATVQRPSSGVASRFLSTTAVPSEILAFYDQAMRAEGWLPFFVDAQNQTSSGPLAVYAKQGRLCMISISPSADSTQNIITLLTKD